MSKYEINREFTSGNYKATVEADKYQQEGEYFVFYVHPGPKKVATISAKMVHSIDTVDEAKA
ncbi:hypothetical protein M3667_01845 [Microbacterium sp. P26]|uniref:hypothetical protein n=1 Tax=Microbacterium TaxID=33882 RepID=UPI002041EBA0|nr:hypothetical protein [Microbacterium sp. P26]MCM3500620.1 hypothetical protein [Microbacterium sp. P26]